MMIVDGEVVSDSGYPCVDIGAAQLFRADDFSRCRFHQRWSGQKNRPLPLDDDRLIGHCRHVRAACRARPHHDGDLRNAFRGHRRLIVEDATEVIAVWKHLGLIGQIGATGVDQIDA